MHIGNIKLPDIPQKYSFTVEMPKYVSRQFKKGTGAQFIGFWLQNPNMFDLLS